MKRLAPLGSHFDRLSLASAQQRVVRGVAAVAGLAFPAVILLAGGDSHPWGWLLLAFLTAGLVIAPDSGFPLAWAGFATLLWIASVPETLDAVLLLAAADLLVVHVACTVASYGPPDVVLPTDLLRLWVGRALLALALTSLAWLAARAFALLDVPPTALVFSAGLCVVGGWAVFLLPRLVTRDGTDS